MRAQATGGEEVRGRGAGKRCGEEVQTAGGEEVRAHCSTALTVSRTSLTKSVPAREEYVSTHEAF